MPGEEVEVPAGIEEPVGVEDLMLGDEEGQGHKKTWKKLESIQGYVLGEEWPKLKESQEEEDLVVVGEEGWCLRKVLKLDRLPRRINCRYWFYNILLA